MKRTSLLLALTIFSLSAFAQAMPDVGSMAKAGAVAEVMNDTTTEAKAPDDKPLKRNSMVVFTSGAVVIIIIAAVAARRRRKQNGLMK